MELWRKTFREGFAPNLSTEQLEFLLLGLAKDDPKLIQGATSTPPPMYCVLDWPTEAGCPTVYPFAFGSGEKTVGESAEFFAKTCFEADRLLGQPGAVRHFLNWVDDTPRQEMREKLSEEVRMILTERFTQKE